ncbi:thiamine pyrophosphate-binding protein [Streptomyces vietnamensis]|uniref:thiamine pyrophosphate-binding protein n=1 Tax=Streptomyces vietnamensis TaxID=362257 RepID=UPI0037A9E9F7
MRERARGRATGGDVLLDGLRAWGVCHVFGCPDDGADGADGVDGLVSAWARAGDDPCLVRARREETAAFEAVGYAKFSGHVGICAASSTPGAVRLLRGLYDAKLDGVPVVAVVGTGRAPPAGPYRRDAAPTVDPRPALEEVASASVETVAAPELLPDALDRAVRTAYARHAPTALVVPADVLEGICPVPGHTRGTRPPSLDASPPAPVPDGGSLERAAALLDAGERVAILVGLGAKGAAREVQEVAERLGAGVGKAMLGLDALSDELPYVTGAIGPLGTGPSYGLVKECDTLLAIGSHLPRATFLPPYGQARAVRIDSDPDPTALRYPYEISLVGDAATTLRRLLPLLAPRADHAWQERVAEDVLAWRTMLARRAASGFHEVNPEHVARALDPLLPGDAMITCDAGEVAARYAGHLRLRHDMRATLSASLAGPGSAVPYAIGAKFAHPDRPSIALVDEGALLTDGLSELPTAATYADEWTDPRLVVAVWNGSGPGMSDRPSPRPSTPAVSYAEFGRSLGLYGIGVSTPGEVEEAWRTALAADRPTVLDFRTAPAAGDRDTDGAPEGG